MASVTQLQKMAILVGIVFFILFFGAFSKSQAAVHYVDKAAQGRNNGSSWTDAWRSFADINWGIISAGDTVYISGGSESKIYYETLNIKKSGESGKLITITKGMDSGHNGTVIIDGSGTRESGVYVYGHNYIKVSKLELKNHKSKDNGSMCEGSISLSHVKGLIIDGNRIQNDRTRGISIHDASDCTISNNYINTGDVSTNYQVDGIYIQFGSNNIIDGNTCIINDKNDDMHMDPIQSWQETNLTVRNNWCELVDGKNNSSSQGIIIQRTFGWVKVYNNVVLGSTYNKWQAMFIDQYNDSSSGTVYAWNNTAIAQHPSGIACRFANTEPSKIGEIKNNICITGEYYAIYIDKGVDNPSKVDNNCYDTNYRDIGFSGGAKSWNEWQNEGLDVHGMHQDPGLDSSYKPRTILDPVVDKGTRVTAFNYDINGTRRPQGVAWDIGAFEFAGSGDNVPSPPSNLHILY